MMLLKLEFLVVQALKEVAAKGKEQDLLAGICYDNHSCQQ